MKRILILVALGLLLCSTASAQGGGGESTKKKTMPKKTSGANSVGRSKPPTRRVPVPATAKLPVELVQQLVSDDENVRKYVDEGNDPSNGFEAQLLDLNQDGKPEYLIRPAGVEWTIGFCGASGRVCSFWLYRRVQDSWELLLSDSASGVLPINSSTNGYRDIGIRYWMGGAAYGITKYKFDGNKYREATATNTTPTGTE